jgi:ZIP family zinc transporter
MARAITPHFDLVTRSDRNLCLLAALAWLGSLGVAGRHGLWLLAVLSVLAAGTFLAGAAASTVLPRQRWLECMDGAAAGAMVYTALGLMTPDVVAEHAGFGIAGLLAGFGVAVVLFRASPSSGGGQTTLSALTLHSLFDGILLGTAYIWLPSAGIGVGVALLAHKAPTGYALARRLCLAERSTILTLLPALATGIAAVMVAIISPLYLPAGILAGAATGLLLFVALIFMASNVVVQRHDPSRWVAFAAGIVVIAVLAWLTPNTV